MKLDLTEKIKDNSPLFTTHYTTCYELKRRNLKLRETRKRMNIRRRKDGDSKGEIIRKKCTVDLWRGNSDESWSRSKRKISEDEKMNPPGKRQRRLVEHELQSSGQQHGVLLQILRH